MTTELYSYRENKKSFKHLYNDVWHTALRANTLSRRQWLPSSSGLFRCSSGL